jgi:hypothetical protein
LDDIAIAVYVILANYAPAFLPRMFNEFFLPLKLLDSSGMFDIKDAVFVLIAFLFFIRAPPRPLPKLGNPPHPSWFEWITRRSIDRCGRVMGMRL